MEEGRREGKEERDKGDIEDRQRREMPGEIERCRMEPAAMNQSGDRNLSDWVLGAGFVIHLLPPPVAC